VPFSAHGAQPDEREIPSLGDAGSSPAVSSNSGLSPVREGHFFSAPPFPGNALESGPLGSMIGQTDGHSFLPGFQQLAHLGDRRRFHAHVAQLDEHEISTLWDAGSSPVVSSTTIAGMRAGDAPVVQRAETAVLKTVCCRFKSCPEHQSCRDPPSPTRMPIRSVKPAGPVPAWKTAGTRHRVSFDYSALRHIDQHTGASPGRSVIPRR
jgi:hypothetical protein